MDMIARDQSGLRADRGPPLRPRVGARSIPATARRRRGRARRLSQARTDHRRRHHRADRAQRRRGLARRHPRRPTVPADRGHQRAGRPNLGAAARRTRPPRPRPRGRRPAQPARNHRRRRRPRPGPPQPMGPRGVRRQPPRPDQPRASTASSTPARTAGWSSPRRRPHRRRRPARRPDHPARRRTSPSIVALGYASTVYSAQGLTVDTSHTVTTSRTGPAAFYVGLTRGDTATPRTCAPRPFPTTRRPAPRTRSPATTPSP